MRRKFIPFCAALALIPATAVNAADRNKDDAVPTPPVFEAVVACRAQTDAAARLACYDQAVAAMASARDAKELVIADRATMREARRGLFGLSLPKLKLFGGSESEDVKEIDAVIDGVSTASDGQFVYTLTDGARWKQIDGRPAYAKKGDAIHIERASLGSYFAKIRGQNARIIRIR